MVAGSWSSTDDRLYAHEAAGLLVGGEDLPQEQQLSYLSTLMQPLLSQIEENLPRMKQEDQQAGTDPAKAGRLPVNMVLQVRASAALWATFLQANLLLWQLKWQRARAVCLHLPYACV